jgi:hypothetical protein
VGLHFSPRTFFENNTIQIIHSPHTLAFSFGLRTSLLPINEIFRDFLVFSSLSPPFVWGVTSSEFRLLLAIRSRAIQKRNLYREVRDGLRLRVVLNTKIYFCSTALLVTKNQQFSLEQTNMINFYIKITGQKKAPISRYRGFQCFPNN